MWIVFLLFPLLSEVTICIAPIGNRFRTTVSLMLMLAVYYVLWLWSDVSHSPIDDGFFVQVTDNKMRV